MATYKILDDYEAFLEGRGFGEVRRRIRADLQAGVVDKENYEELLADLEDEEAGFAPAPPGGSAAVLPTNVLNNPSLA
jgi:hypothetical protein